MEKKGLRWRQCAKRTSYKVSSSWSTFWTTILLHINLYYKSNSHCSSNQLKPIFNWGIHILRLQCIGYPSESEMHCPVAAQHFWPAQNHTPAMTSGMHHSRSLQTPMNKFQKPGFRLGRFHIFEFRIGLGRRDPSTLRDFLKIRGTSWHPLWPWLGSLNSAECWMAWCPGGASGGQYVCHGDVANYSNPYVYKTR